VLQYTVTSAAVVVKNGKPINLRQINVEQLARLTSCEKKIRSSCVFHPLDHSHFLDTDFETWATQAG
jgi:hypothetical protein